MRWKGFIPFLVLIGIVCVVSILFMDRWIEGGIEKTGEAIVGAKVEMDGLHFNLFNLSVEWDRFQVTDPKNTMQNLIEIGRTDFNMRSAALLRKWFVIEEITVADVRSGTERAYDGALPPKKQEAEESDEPGMLDHLKDQLQREIDQLPVMQLSSSDLTQKLNVDSLVQMADLKVLDRVDSLKTDLNQTSDEWNRFLSDFHPEEELKMIRDNITSIDPKGIKTVPELVAALGKVQSAQSTMQNLKETVDLKYREAHDDFDRFSYYPQHIDRWINEDYQRILQKAKLPDLSAQNIGKRLFGQEMVNRIQTWIDYYALIQKIIPEKKEKPEKEERPRLEGQTIHFADRHGWPSFLIEHLLLSGQTGSSDEQPGFVMQGEASGITSQPWIYGKPTVIDLRGARGEQRSLRITGSFDHTTTAIRDSIAFALQNIPLQNMAIAETPYLPSSISRGWADVNAFTRIAEGYFEMQIHVNGRDVAFGFESFEADNVLSQAIQKILAGLNRIDIQTNLYVRDAVVDFRLTSNLDQVVSNELKKMGSQALAEAETRIRQRIDQLSRDRITDLEHLLTQNQVAVLGPIDQYKKQSDAIRTLIDEKLQEVQADINQRQQGEAGDLQERAKSLLEDLFNQ
ncbi:TIGR03545 family protein [bacterium]|nr:TIGR03545 family protein [bacterium]